MPCPYTCLVPDFHISNMKFIRSQKTYECRSAGETIELAKDFASCLQGGSAVGLEGPLGSGKTTFVKGLALGLGLADEHEVKSPTFVLMHVYPTRIPLYHFDLYRLESEKEIEAIGFEDFAADPSGVVCVEWAEKAEKFFSGERWRIRFEITDGDRRRIHIAYE